MHLLYYFICFYFLIVIHQCEEELYYSGPFGKLHLKSEIPSPFNCNRTLGRSLYLSTAQTNAINVSTTKYSNKEEISLSWTPLINPCIDDFIGLYFIEVPIETGACDYVDYEFIKANQTNSKWSMINLRHQLEFRYYTRDKTCTGNYMYINRSPIIEPINYNEPTQIHLAFTNRYDQIYVSYVTNSNMTIPKCQYGLDSSSLLFQVNGTSKTYKATDMCEGKANIVGPQTFIDPGFMHTIIINDLLPSTIYYYRVGNDEHGWSTIHHFRNRPSDYNERVNLIAYGDMGLSPIQSGAKPTVDRILSRIQSNNISSILHIGDISYARGIGVLWDAFMSQIEPIAALAPYMVAIGNHEYDHETGGDKDPSGASGPGGFRPVWGDYGFDSGGECAVPMVNRFHSPTNGNGLFWYSFDVGPIHIIYYSTEHDFRRSSTQYKWLENDLRSVDRTRTPWLIVGSHRPMYSSLIQIDLIKVMLQFHIEPLLFKYNVDLNLFAHIHSYERTCPMYQNRCVEKGVTHVLIGMGGHDLSYGSYSDAKWSVYHDIDYGYTFISANRTHLLFDYFHTADDKLIDQFYLMK